MTEQQDPAIAHHEAEAKRYDQLAADQWELVGLRRMQGEPTARHVAAAEDHERQAADERKLVELRGKAMRDLEALKANLNDDELIGEEYAREGCMAVVKVRSDGTLIEIYFPNGAPRTVVGPAKTAAGAARMLQDWIEGRKPRPSNMADRDQS